MKILNKNSKENIIIEEIIDVIDDALLRYYSRREKIIKELPKELSIRSMTLSCSY